MNNDDKDKSFIRKPIIVQHDANENDEVSDITVFPRKLNFLSYKTNQFQSKKVLITNSSENKVRYTLQIPQNLPFSLSETDIEIFPGKSKSLFVMYCPKSQGISNYTLKIGTNQNTNIEIAATCYESHLEIPDQDSKAWSFTIPFDISHEIPIKNISDEIVRFSTGCNFSGVFVECNEYQLDPKEKIDFKVSVDGEKINSAECDIKIYDHSSNVILTRKISIKKYEIPAQQQQKPQHTEQKSIENTISLTMNDETNNKIIKEQEEKSHDIEIEPKVLIFPNIEEENYINRKMMVVCDGDFQLEGPRWLKFPKSIPKNQLFSVFCNKISKKSVVSKINAISGNNIASIPVLAYHGKSCVEIPRDVCLKYSFSNEYKGKMKLINKGEISAFVSITIDEKHMKSNLLISNPTAIIPPNSSKSFEFIMKGIYQGTRKIPVKVFTGDEILRQILSITNPNHFFAQSFKNTNNEIEFAQQVIDDIDPKIVLSEFENNLRVNEIKIYNQSLTESKKVFVRPEALNVLVNNTSYLTISNLSSDKVNFTAFAFNPAVKVYPLSGILMGYSTVKLSVECSEEVESTIEIHTNAGNFSIRVSSEDIPKPRNIIKQGKYLSPFSLNVSRINFGVCENLGSIKKHVVIRNLEDKNIVVQLKLSSEFEKIDKIVRIPKVIELDSHSMTEFVIEFSPLQKVKYEAEIELECDGFVATLEVEGSGMSKKNRNKLGCETENLVFPTTKVGQTKAATLKIFNRTETKQTIEAIVPYPFNSHVSKFSIEPKMYVRFPIEFAAVTSGSYSADVIFAPHNSQHFVVNVSGNATN